MTGISGAGGAGYLNNLIATSFANPESAAAAQAARISDMNLRADAARAAAKAGAGANVNIQYQYAVGPDGQLYASGATVSTSRKGRADEALLDPSLRSGAPSQPLNLQDARPRSFADLLAPRASLSPADEAAIFGSPEFLAEIQDSGEASRRARLQIADFGVRAQERQHYMAAGGFGSLPQYDYEIGPDGELYAVAGSVNIKAGPAATPEEAARNAATIAGAALAATDVSAQDISVARNAQSQAAALYSRNYMAGLVDEGPSIQRAA